MLLEFQNVTFIHADAIHPIFTDLNLSFSPGWTGVVGANGAGKTTLLELACGNLTPRSGRVVGRGLVVLCPQRTQRPPDLLESFLQAEDGDAQRLRGQLGVSADWGGRWSTLSHGERKRAQIGLALWRRPDVLAVDEPTNHIDALARELLLQALRQFQGVGILVSHDRELLDSLCTSCVFLRPGSVRVRPGGYTAGASQAAMEHDSLFLKRQEASRRLQKLESELQNRKRRAQRADSKDSKRGISPKDHDAKAKINLGRLTGKDAVDCKLSAQLEGRVGRLRQEMDSLTLEVPKETGIWMPGTCSSRDSLFLLPRGQVPLPDGRFLSHEGLRMGPSDRVGITGPNGGGKTSLVRYILAHLMIPDDKVLYLPQELSDQQAQDSMSQLSRLSRQERGLVLTIVSRLGSGAPRLMESTAPSPGELRKLRLALGILHTPHLILMDEPTNHLDITAIECLETALTDCPCGLLLVSHDRVFLRHLVARCWQVEEGLVREVQVRRE